MTKGRIIGALILLAVLSGFGAVYQFYFKEKLEAYSRDVRFQQTLDKTFAQLREKFSGVKPELLTQEWRGETQPWRDAVASRARYYTFGDWFEHPRPEEDTNKIIKFWYGEDSREMGRDLYQKLSENMGRYDLLPRNVFADLGVSTVDDWVGVDVTEKAANQQLARLSFGISVYEMLLEAKAAQILSVEIWPQRKEKAHSNLLNLQTVGMRFLMSARNLVEMLEDMRMNDRFFTVDGLRVQYPYIAYQQEPALQVEMLITQANYVAQKKGGGGGGGAPQQQMGPGGGPRQGQPQSAREIFMQRGGMRGGMRGGPQQEQEEPGAISKAWTWFKRNILYMH
mgnify:FL=1